MHRDGITEMKPPIAIDANHFARLFALSSMTSEPMTEVCEYLREELDRARVLPAEKLRPDIVSLGSQVEFRDEQTGKTQEIIETAEIIAAGLDASGIRVMLDDRSASVGVKLTDAELLGVPTICVVGRGVADGLVEIRDRVSGSKQDVSLAEIAELLREIVKA